VHRDVSPQNVLISYEGDIKLCDFGIVKAVTKASKTQMGALKGKLQYMSPEQAWGRPVDARSDIFSLGSLLFEMLTGRRLFSGESEMSVLDAVREGRIQAPRDLDPRLPLEVNALVLKALARDPDDRFHTAGEMQREIDGILASLKPTPSQADLGTYLHQLFAAEAQAGGTPAVATATPAALAASRSTTGAPSAAVPARQAEVAVVAPTGVSKIEEPEGGRSSKMLWIAIGGVAAAGLLVYVLLGRGKPSSPPAAPAGTESSAAADAGGTEATGTIGAPGATDVNRPAVDATGAGAAAPSTTAPVAGPTNVDQLVSDEVKRREAELKKKYEDELERRKTEIEKLNNKPQAATPPAAAPAVPAPAPEAPPEPAPAAEPVVETPGAAVAAPAQVVETPQVTAPQAPETPRVKEGDLVRPGAGVKPPVLVSLTKPEYPAMARRLKVEGTVVVSLLVDENGHIAETRLESGVSQNVGINEAALAAARSAVFSPATESGVRVKMWYQIKIPFKL
ncbi:MAG: TonB family protein, partial [Thermoanaerobaculia bacterium]